MLVVAGQHRVYDRHKAGAQYETACFWAQAFESLQAVAE